MEGVYGIYHIIYLILAIIIGVLLYINCLKIKNIKLFYKLIGLLIIVIVFINRFSVTKCNIENGNASNYWGLLPSTFCGLTSFLMGISLLFGKKNNLLFHGVVYVGFIGCLVTMLYPDFLETQTFFDIRSLTGMLHHSIVLTIIPILFKTKWFVPDLKKWYVLPIMLSFYMTLGLFEMDALGMDKPMQIERPLLENVKLTSWYIVGPVAIILSILFQYFYTKKINRKN